MIALSTLVALALVALPTTASATSKKPDGAVVLVHGWMGSPDNMEPIADYLSEQQYGGPVYSYNYHDTSNDPITTSAERLWQYLVDNKLTETEVNLVGHSMGGLVIRQMLTTHGKSLHLGKLVTLGTPNNGASPAMLCTSLWCTSAMRDMKAGSPFLNKLNTTTALSYEPESTMAYGVGQDEMVSGAAAYLPGARNLFVAHNAAVYGGTAANHNGIVAKKQVLDDILTFLRSEPAMPSGVITLSGAKCALIGDRGTVSWKLPASTPTTEVEIVNGKDLTGTPVRIPAATGTMTGLSTGTHLLRAVDPVTSKATKWSAVTFDKKLTSCAASVQNNTGRSIDE